MTGLQVGLAVFGALATLSNFLNAWLTSQVKTEITLLKLEVANQRMQEREWMEARYITRAEVDQRLRPLEARVGL